jgi:PTH1 family peptidyl-tRNA hydrolase
LSVVKVIAGLGNPGSEYDDTRHNVGWWVLDRLSYDWGFDGFVRDGPARVSEGVVEGVRVRLVKPSTYMNRSGAALAALRRMEDFDPTRDLLVVVDDATLAPGRVRFRPRGGAGGHNGLKSVQAVLGTQEYPRLRVGVGVPPQGMDLADWVLSPMAAEDEDQVVGLLPSLSEACRVWLQDGVEESMNQFNR